MIKEAARNIQEKVTRARESAAALLDPKNHIYKPANRFLAYSALAVGVLALSGVNKEDSVALAAGCAPLSTDGKPATCLTADKRIEGIAEQMGLYYRETTGNGKFDLSDEVFMPVQDRRFAVMTLEGGVSSDYVQPDFDTLRHNANGDTEVLDLKNNQWRRVTKIDIRTVKENGDGRAVDEANNPQMKVEKNAGDDVDKIWTSLSPLAAESNGKHSCENGGQCTWQCVEWKLVARLDSRADVSDVLKGGEFLKRTIHRFKDEKGQERISAIAHPIFLFDRSTEPVEVSTSFINTPFEPGSEFAQKNQIVKKPVYTPFTRVPVTNYTLDSGN